MKEKEQIGVVLSDSGFSEYLRIKDLVPILQNLYPEFDQSFFLEQVQRFQLPKEKESKLSPLV